jgi:hypothetical protein
MWQIIIGHVVAKFYASKRSIMDVDNLWSPTLLYNKSYLMNFRRWNYNYVLLSDNEENL